MMAAKYTIGKMSMAHSLRISVSTLESLMERLPEFAGRRGEKIFCRDDFAPLKAELDRFRADGLTASAAAQYLGVPYMRAAMWRKIGIGPRFRKLGGIVRYAREDVEEYARKRNMREEKMIDAKETAAILRCSDSHLFVLRERGGGPAWEKAEGRIWYDRESVYAYALNGRGGVLARGRGRR